ncbi:hypothetical protein PR048_024399 [Dryococelus australis]|uniref:Uncharacterized protein n=1 Tax=Dryococelus australis TaxID=614101 RepID=A0ABQ9GNH9_9NEOP|nr:hypothetical protein PR048_024399 [Dryococelus australis]
MCLVCNKHIGCAMKSQLYEHVASAMRTKNKTLQSSKGQVLLTQRTNLQVEEMNFSKTSAELWCKLQVPEYRTFLQKYQGQEIPDEFKLRENYLDSCCEDAL